MEVAGSPPDQQGNRCGPDLNPVVCLWRYTYMRPAEGSRISRISPLAKEDLQLGAPAFFSPAFFPACTSEDTDVATVCVNTRQQTHKDPCQHCCEAMF